GRFSRTLLEKSAAFPKDRKRGPLLCRGCRVAEPSAHEGLAVRCQSARNRIQLERSVLHDQCDLGGVLAQTIRCEAKTEAPSPYGRSWRWARADGGRSSSGPPFRRRRW